MRLCCLKNLSNDKVGAVMRNLSAERKRDLKCLTERLGIDFSDFRLLDEALTHKSYANEADHDRDFHNERLEFLGDAVMELATSTYLFKHFPHLPEGELTKGRASVVCSTTLSKRAAELGLGNFLLLGRGEAACGGASRVSNLENTFEAVIGAVYLDQGWAAAADYVIGQLKDELKAIDSGNNLQDYKTTLQEVIQQHANQSVSYELVNETGPDHDKRFEFTVCVNGQVYGSGTGRSKKEAEQKAAKEALTRLKSGR